MHDAPAVPVPCKPTCVVCPSWSDHFDVTVARAAAPEVDGRAVGPFNVTDSELLVGAGECSKLPQPLLCPSPLSLMRYVT